MKLPLLLNTSNTTSARGSDESAGSASRVQAATNAPTSATRKAAPSTGSDKRKASSSAASVWASASFMRADYSEQKGRGKVATAATKTLDCQRGRSLNRHDKRAPNDGIENEYDDGESHAADEPTAVWDESALRAAGLTDLLNKRKSEPPPPPATKSTAPQRPSIEVSEEMARAAAGLPAVEPVEPPPPPVMEPAPEQPSGGLGWGATLGLAVVLGAIVYVLIRFIKG